CRGGGGGNRGDDGTASSSSSLSASPRQAIAVARVLAGSQADVAGGLHVGDIIREANGQPMETPEALQRLLRQTVGRSPCASSHAGRSRRCRLRRADARSRGCCAPASTTSLSGTPCCQPRAGPALPAWRRPGGCRPERRGLLGRPVRWSSGEDPARLIPSQTLEEREGSVFPGEQDRARPRDRAEAAVTPSCNHQKKPVMYRAQSAADFDRAELRSTEDVAQLAASPVSLCWSHWPAARWAETCCARCSAGSYPLKFAAPRLISSDPERCGDAGGDLEFMPRQEMLAAIAAGDLWSSGDTGQRCWLATDLIGLSLESVRGSVSTGASSGLTVVSRLPHPSPCAASAWRSASACAVPGHPDVAASASCCRGAVPGLGRSLRSAAPSSTAQD
uniref:PDZ domain-containing protein n=1 Tax=Macrostomum lignano TaxID=282301 RepID=A0A1I8FI23_9PLAT